MAGRISCPALYSYGHLPAITGYFYGIIHSINGVLLVLSPEKIKHIHYRFPKWWISYWEKNHHLKQNRDN